MVSNALFLSRLTTAFTEKLGNFSPIASMGRSPWIRILMWCDSCLLVFNGLAVTHGCTVLSMLCVPQKVDLPQNIQLLLNDNYYWQASYSGRLAARTSQL